MRCATHPDVETSLRCGKCGRGLAVVAGTAVGIGYGVSIFPTRGRFFSLFNMLYLIRDLLALALGIFVAVTRLR